MTPVKTTEERWLEKQDLLIRYRAAWDVLCEIDPSRYPKTLARRNIAIATGSQSKHLRWFVEAAELTARRKTARRAA